MAPDLDSAFIPLHRLVAREATSLALRFIAGVSKPARPSTPEDAANTHQYACPPRTAEQVAA